MSGRPWLATGVLGFLVGKLVVLGLNLRWFPVLRPAEAEREAGDQGAARAGGDDGYSAVDVAVLVPMRDEAHRLPGTLSGLLAATTGRIYFLDDESADGSAELVRRRAARDPRVTVLTGTPRPDGWAGKTWACAQLADAALRAGAQVLVFVDADVELAPGAVAAVLAELRRQRADVFSVFPRQLVRSWPERLLLPLIDDVVLCFLPHRLLSLPVPAAATASGMVLAFTESAYRRLGGFDAVRTEVVEDVALARLTRRRGLQLGLALGGDVAGVRMYRGWSEIITGMGRGLTPAAGGRRTAVLAGWLWHVAAYTLPVVLAVRSRRWAAAAFVGIAERVLVEIKTGGRDWSAACAVAAAPLAAAPVVLRALRREHVWKGRVYR